MDQIIDGRRADPPAVELDRLANRAFDLVRSNRLTTCASRLLAAAAAYTAHASGVLGWAGTLGEDRTVSEAVGTLGALAAAGITEQSTLGWNRAECDARQAARHLITTVRAAMAGNVAGFTQLLTETTAILAQVATSLDDRPTTTCLPSLPEAVGR